MRPSFTDFYSPRTVRRSTWLLLLLLSFGLLAHAAVPMANTVIGNQAAASYVDASGTLRTVTSNLVQTTVAQVGAFLVSNGTTRTATAGSVVYVPHTITNAGNGTDSFTIQVVEAAGTPGFSNVAVYPDANGNGIASSSVPLCTTNGNSCSSVGFSQEIAGNGTSFRFLVAYTLPITVASDGTTLSATVGARPTDVHSSFYSTYTPNTLASTDRITLTTAAAFTVMKAIAAPSFAAAAGQWPVPNHVGPASVGNCPLQWSETLVAANPTCTYTVYSLRYTNTATDASAVGALTLEDTLPPGMQYVQGSSVWSAMGGVALQEGDYTLPQGNGLTPIYYAYDRNRRTLMASISRVSPNSSGAISFVVLVGADAAPSTSSTTNQARYFPDQCDASQRGVNPNNCSGLDPVTRPQPPVLTNAAPFVVRPRYGVVAARERSVVQDASDPPPHSGMDVVQQPSMTAGGSQQFAAVITNTGSTTDTFNLEVTSPQGRGLFPPETQYQLAHSDGVSPLTDTNQDGVVDTGPVAPGASVTVVVRVQLPNIVGLGDGPFQSLLTATSVRDDGQTSSAAHDSVWIEVLRIIGSLVDLTASATGNQVVSDASGAPSVEPCRSGANCDIGPGPSILPSSSVTTEAGAPARFDVYIRNNDRIDNTYDLTAAVPVGWLATFVDPANPDCANAAAMPTVVLTAGSQRRRVLCVTPSASATLGVQTITISARSQLAASSGARVADAITYAVRVHAIDRQSLQLMPTLAEHPVMAGSSAIYSVILSNAGTSSCATGAGGFDVDAQLDAAAVSAGWTAMVYLDRNTQGGAAADSVALGSVLGVAPGNLNNTVADGAVTPLDPGQQLRLQLRVFAPMDALANTSASVRLIVKDVSPAACPQRAGLYTSTAQLEHVRLHKMQVLDPTCGGSDDLLVQLSTAPLQVAPGQCLVYQVQLINDGSAPVANVSLSDGIPAYTRYAIPPAAQPTVQCAATGLQGDAVSVGNSARGGVIKSVSCSSAANTLDPTGTLTLRFSVQVDQ